MHVSNAGFESVDGNEKEMKTYSMLINNINHKHCNTNVLYVAYLLNKKTNTHALER